MSVAALAILLVAPVGAAPEDQLNLNGNWIVTSRSTGESGKIRLKHSDRTVTGTTIPDGDAFLDGRLSGKSFSGRITLWDEETRSQSTKTDLRLTVADDGYTMSGDYDNKEYVPDERKWEVPKAEADRIVGVDLAAACQPFAGPITLGKGRFGVTISLSEPLHPLKPDEDSRPRDGYCHYLAGGVASLRLNVGGGDGVPLSFSVPVSGCDIDFYLKEKDAPDDPDEFQDVALVWNDNGTGAITAFDKWGVSFILYSMGVTFRVDEDGSIRLSEAAVAVKLDAEREVHLGGPVYLGGGVSAIISYEWTEDARSWTDGEWDFDGMADVEVQVRRGGSTPIAVFALRNAQAGVFEARLDLTANRKFRLNGFEVELVNSSLRARINVPDGSWSLLDGQITGKIRVERINAEFDIKLVYSDPALELKIESAGEFELFGGKCQDLALSVNLDTDSLEFTRVEGRLKWLLEGKFDSAIDIRRFLIENGELKEFLGAGRVGYRGFELDITELKYDATTTPAKISVTASLDLRWSKAGAGAVTVRNFEIDTSGNVSNFDIEASVNAAPVSLRLKAKYDGKELSGEFRGDLAGTIGIKGSVVVGANPETSEGADDGFVYGYLAISVELGRGIPIGQSGLKVIGLNGAVGCNYVPPDSPIEPKEGGPRRDIFYLAGGITIGDVGGLMALNGTLAITLGAATSFQISGTVQVTQRTPYFRGTVTAGYELGSGNVNGKLESTVKIPLSGSVVDVERNKLRYRVGSNRWRLNGEELGGTFFSVLTISDGSIDLNSTLSAPISDLAGSLRARLSGGTSWEVSKSALGFTLSGSLRISLNGDTSVRLGPSDITGSFQLRADATGRLQLTTPRIPFIGSRTYTKRVSAYGRVRANSARGRLRASGDIRISDDSGNAFDVDFDYVF